MTVYPMKNVLLLACRIDIRARLREGYIPMSGGSTFSGRADERLLRRV